MSKKNLQIKIGKIPQHIAIIMDGNGRWAKARHLPRMAGHRAGTENLRRIIRACAEFGVKYLTVYAFSTENWKRPKDEINGLMQILSDVIDRELVKLHEEGVQMRHIGRLEGLPPALQEKIKSAIEKTKNNDRLILIIAWNYGSRNEIVHSIQQILLKEEPNPEEITEALVSKYLFTGGIPDPDLVIRTSGEMRTSNFLLWQSAYAEWYFTPILWPDFNREALQKAIIAYGKRERRFGGRSKQQKKDNYAD
jgi:undecaprenyl diphosphate synthase